MEFLFENVNMISNRRGENCNAQRLNFITSYFLNAKSVACYEHGFIKQRWILAKKQTKQLRSMIVPTATSGEILRIRKCKTLFTICQLIVMLLIFAEISQAIKYKMSPARLSVMPGNCDFCKFTVNGSFLSQYLQ